VVKFFPAFFICVGPSSSAEVHVFIDDCQIVAYTHGIEVMGMEFLSIREFNSSPGKSREKLRKNGKIVLTNNGKPSMLVFDIAGQDFEALIDILNRAEAMRILDEIQLQAARNGLASMTGKNINAEIEAFRKEKKAI
jgi:hypothetical protein